MQWIEGRYECHASKEWEINKKDPKDPGHWRPEHSAHYHFSNIAWIICNRPPDYSGLDVSERDIEYIAMMIESDGFRVEPGARHIKDVAIHTLQLLSEAV